MYMGHDHSCPGIEGQRSRLGLGSEFKMRTRLVRPRSLIEDAFLVAVLLLVRQVLEHNVLSSVDKMMCK